MRRSLSLFAVFSLATAFACSDARTVYLAADAGPEAGSIKAKTDGGGDTEEDAGVTKRDSGKKPPPDASEPPPPACSPGDVSGFTPQWIPPTTLHQGACSATQITTMLDCFFNASAVQATCDAFEKAPANKACQTCAVTPSTGASLGPIVITTDSLITLNIAGCVARTANQMTSTGCGAKMQAARECASAACATNCPVPDGDQQALADRNACQTAAQSAGCMTYETASDTCSDPLLQGASSACANGTTFEDVASSLVTLFCGP